MVSTPGADICKEESRQKAEMQVQGRSRVPPHMGARVRELLAQSREIEGVHVSHANDSERTRMHKSARFVSKLVQAVNGFLPLSLFLARAHTHAPHLYTSTAIPGLRTPSPCTPSE